MILWKLITFLMFSCCLCCLATVWSQIDKQQFEQFEHFLMHNTITVQGGGWGNRSTSRSRWTSTTTATNTTATILLYYNTIIVENNYNLDFSLMYNIFRPTLKIKHAYNIGLPDDAVCISWSWSGSPGARPPPSEASLSPSLTLLVG